MASPAICVTSTAISNGSIMVKDMWPNRSQANPVVDPAPQGPRYLRVVETPTLPVLDGTVVAQTVSGLASYLLVTLDRGGVAANVTPAEAVAMAEAIIADMRAGAELTLVDINGLLAGVVAGTGLVGTGQSTATVNNVLQILAGATFTVPAGYDLEDAGNNPQWLSEADQLGFFSAFFNPIVEEDSSFWISLAQGDISGLKTANFVVVYDGEGNTI